MYDRMEDRIKCLISIIRSSETIQLRELIQQETTSSAKGNDRSPKSQ